MTRILIVDDDRLLRAEVRKALGAQGFEVFEAEDGQEGLAAVQAHKPDLVILDFVMPRMNGVQFASSLRSLASWQRTPLIILSGRTDVVSDEFVKRLGIRDVVSKPFEPAVLISVVRHALREKEATSSRRLSFAPPPFPASGRDTADLDPLVALLGRQLSADGRSSVVRGEHLERALSGLGEEELSLVVLALVARKEGPALVGNLADLPLVDVLQMLCLQRKNGVLEVKSGTRRIQAQLTQGCLEMALLHSACEEHWLGRYLVAEEIITRQDLEMLLRNRSDGYLLGRQVVSLGYATFEEVERALARQTEDIIYEALRWPHGTFVFRAGARLFKSFESKNRLDVSRVIMEGLRRIDEWRLFERKIPHLDIVLNPCATAAATALFEELSTEEAFVYSLVNGLRSVRNIVDEAGLDSFTACQYLHRLVQVGLVAR